MGYPRTVIHCNSGLAHQVEVACALKLGFSVHGIDAIISPRPDTQADTHVVMGPWFALNQWKFSNTLYIDRAYWGDPKCVSVHWLRNGEKYRTKDNKPRAHPEVKPWKTGTKPIVLCDYGMNCNDMAESYGADLREHPAGGENKPISAILEEYDIAIGCRTTALVDAAIAGLTVHTGDKNSPVWPIQGKQCDREQWLNDLAWHNWSKTEISRGEMWATIHYQS